MGVVQRSSQSRWGRLVGRRLPGSRSYRAADVQGWDFSNLYQGMGSEMQIETPRTTLIPVPLQPIPSKQAPPAKVPTIFPNIIIG